MLHRIFVGKIIYEVNPLWVNEVIVTPKNKAVVRIKIGVHYTILPLTNQLIRGNSYEMKKKNEIIKITYL